MFELAKIMHVIGGTEIMLVLTLITAAVLFYRKFYHDAVIVAVSMFLSTLVTFVLKNIFQTPRPLEMLILETGSRFPSGHATAAATACALSLYFVHKYVKSLIAKSFLYLLSFAWLTISAYSRLYLKVHIPIDVIAGCLIGFLSVVVAYGSLRKIRI